ncbi:MFS transporter [Pseudomonas sp. LABIM340]|uniref:MFS transporter n=1 Tax=Pseudomonas nitroreducens TaxID=46680 RepID=A0A5R8ZV24_PSENT|nr:MFS transporter [Pseudomonas nitroreducens]TLP70222.1 MFS transporter [Pseudomonas nitroreducens]
MSQTCNIPDVIDHAALSSFQWRVFVLCFLVAIFDGFDTQAIAYTGPAIIETLQLSTGGLAPILSAGIVGMALGAMALGLFGDRFGRRPTVMGAVALFALATLATAFASSAEQILVLRFLAGLGMGGATPVLLALASEYGPARLRGAIVTGILLGLPAGAMLGGLLAAQLMPLIGWQGIFLAGGLLPLVLLVGLYFALPESLQFLATRSGETAQVRRILARISSRTLADDVRFSVPEAATRTSVRALFGPGLARNTLAVWLTYLFNWVAWFMFLSWLPTVLKTAGLPVEQAPLGTVTVNAVFILCAIPLSILLPRLNTRNVLLGLFALGVLVSLGLSLSGDNWVLVFLLVGAAGLGIGGQQIALNYLVVSAYPTSLRATATGWAIGLGRVGAIIGSALGGTFLEWGGVAGFYLALAIPLLLALVAVALIRGSEKPSGGLVAAH